MKVTTRPMPTSEDQRLLDGVTVRLLAPEEREHFDPLLVAQHHLHSAALVGEQLRYVTEYQGQWVALLAWNAAAFNLKAHEAWIGWTAPQKKPSAPRRQPQPLPHPRRLARAEPCQPRDDEVVPATFSSRRDRPLRPPRAAGRELCRSNSVSGWIDKAPPEPFGPTMTWIASKRRQAAGHLKLAPAASPLLRNKPGREISQSCG